MATGGNRSMLAQLWQVPLLGAAIVAFTVSLAIVARTPARDVVAEKIVEARKLLDAHQVKPTLDLLNAVLSDEKPTRSQQGAIRQMLAQAVDEGQRGPDGHGERVPANDATIVRQYHMAELAGAKLSAQDYVRFGEAQESLGKKSEAVSAYATALGLDPSLRRTIGRRQLELQLATGLDDDAADGLPKYLELPDLTDPERAWALMALADLHAKHAEFADATGLLEKARTLDVDDVTKGIIACREGEIALAQGDSVNADLQFRLARQLLTVRQDLDARAAYRLGTIRIAENKPAEAAQYFKDVLVSHPGSETFVLSRLGRGWSRILENQDDAGLEDLSWVSNQLNRPEIRRRDGPEALAAFEKIEAALAQKGNFQGALEVMGEEKELLADPGAMFWGRLSVMYEKRAAQVASGAGSVETATPEQDKVLSLSRQLRSRAAEAALTQARCLTLSDNEGYGAALWRAIDLYDKADAPQSAIALMELFARERPSDELAPECLLRLGRTYMATGQFDRAISAFERNQMKYGKSWAATQSAIPLAQALIAKGEKSYGQAEQVLLNVLDNNLALTPEAVEFRLALYELARLYHRQGRYEDSIARFDELLKRYPNDDRAGEVYFLMGDGFRKSAGLLAKADAATIVDTAEAETARRDRIAKARALFDRVVAYYREHVPAKDSEKSELRLAHFYRADCAYDLGQYEDAIRLYDQAAFRYQDDASALAAYVQIVNANVALGKTADAKAANERAKWLLKRMPASAFADGPGGMSRAYWEQWLKWSGETSMKAGTGAAANPSGANIADAGRTLPK
jgi:tetratricopeptide (TPR) repeat protein